ncbi:hypothetical protein VC83_01409 [Pseudogymnoascus destructans]|uniref:Uncharacterized protein n=2 Tax=Pseudogymnoascus destructans TaxID=655981 RepID=L8FPC6_PSED2|nr:uncharacterized protein VC83_01409 [Pseudogymnoascus destructans]ELR02323.1 hypothetical protein GMDG_05390 [Pseudogymnoascus destructans 20631-21]OAF61881.1 hypothetical protein VC83_01409 [Pseudogymnoascus destructans]
MSTNAQSNASESLTSRPLSIQPSANQDALDLVKMVDDLLAGISTRFTATWTELFSKMDEMARRLDHLESSILARDSQDDASRTPKK